MYFCCKPCSLEPTLKRRLLCETWLHASNKPINLFPGSRPRGSVWSFNEIWFHGPLIHYCCISTSLMKLEVTFLPDWITREFWSARNTATYINPHTTPSFGRNQKTRLTHIDHIRQSRHQLRPGNLRYLQEPDVCEASKEESGISTFEQTPRSPSLLLGFLLL